MTGCALEKAMALDLYLNCYLWNCGSPKVLPSFSEVISSSQCDNRSLLKRKKEEREKERKRQRDKETKHTHTQYTQETGSKCSNSGTSLKSWASLGREKARHARVREKVCWEGNGETTQTQECEKEGRENHSCYTCNKRMGKIVLRKDEKKKKKSYKSQTTGIQMPLHGSSNALLHCTSVPVVK